MRVPFVSRYDRPGADRWIALLNAELSGAVVVHEDDLGEGDVAAARVAVVAGPRPEQVARFPKLEWVSSTWAGVGELIRGLPPRVGIARLVDPNLTARMAEAVLTAVLLLHRELPSYRRQQAARQWRQHDYTWPRERTVGILGLGELGRAAAAALVPHGFRVVGWSRSAKELPGVESRTGEAGLDAVLAEADILVGLLPHTPATDRLLDAERLARMKPGASLVNFGRGSLIDEAALLQRLGREGIRDAVLDVYAAEPLPPEHPFWTHPRVTVLPHISALTEPASASRLVAADLQRWLATGALPPLVDRARGY